jgi:hypothetical protein
MLTLVTHEDSYMRALFVTQQHCDSATLLQLQLLLHVLLLVVLAMITGAAAAARATRGCQQCIHYCLSYQT